MGEDQQEGEGLTNGWRSAGERDLVCKWVWNSRREGLKTASRWG